MNFKNRVSRETIGLKTYFDFYITIWILIFIGMNSGCTHGPGKNTSPSQALGSKAFVAVAKIRPKSDTETHGTIAMKERPDGQVEVVARIEKATPGKHGFHIHEKGDCSATDASSAGGHYNPTNKIHGAPQSDEHHVGDLGNIEINTEGFGTLRILMDPKDFSDWDDLYHRAVVVHARRDDLRSQPSGNAGVRIACGVLERPPAISSK